MPAVRLPRLTTTPKEMLGVGLFVGIGTAFVALDSAEPAGWLVTSGGFALATLGWLQMRRWGARNVRLALGQCLACGYDLTGNVSGVCPECGTPAAGDR